MFEGLVSITKNDQSSGNRLYALPDSKITAKYSDRTLPDPYNTSDDLDIFAYEIIVSDVPTNERLTMEETEILGQSGNIIDELGVGQTGMIFSKVENILDFPQNFAYIVQIKDENSDVVSLSWVTGQVIPSQELGMSVSWIPEESGKYLIERFIWVSIKGGIPLTNAVSTEILIE